jgi:class 3 adenylate cyclase
MSLKELIAEAEEILRTKWETRDGRKVPEAEDVDLDNDAVTLEGTVLYADMADSTGLVDGFKPWFAAKIYKTYLAGACRIIRDNGGEITAFDGDRVMAVFIGNYKNTSAAKTALQINAFVIELNQTVKAVYPNTSYVLCQSVGVDTSNLFVARTGIRTYNDLVWVGRAANYAAKLCALGDGTYPSHITEEVFSKLSDEAKFGGKARESMWEKRIWNTSGKVIYRSNWSWKP